VGISGYRRLVIKGSASTGFYQSIGVFANGTFKAATKLCYLNQISFPSSVTSMTDGITGFEKKTSTLLHCTGNLVNDYWIILSGNRLILPCHLWLSIIAKCCLHMMNLQRRLAFSY